jgi:hypothetical protein|tara:strand:- start:2275 stop:2607 length:333 start_codon:yes stop_codon:yes gene_type:complete
MAINNTLIGASDTIILDVPAGKKYAVSTILVCNYAPTTSTTYDSSFDMHVIKTSGGVKGNANKVLNNVEMPAQETFSFNTERLILEEGDRVLLISPDADKLSAVISYLEV